MFEIKYYTINKSFSTEFLTEENLHYAFLLGGITFAVNNDAIEMSWDWIPLFGFALSLREISTSLSECESATRLFEFTESDDTIRITKNLDDLQIQPSFSSITLTISFQEFLNELNRFYESLKNYITENNTDKKIGPVLKKYF